MNGWKTAAFYLCILYIIIAPILLFVIYDAGFGVVIAVVISGIVCAFLIRLDEIEVFELWTLKVKLQREIALAEKALRQLKELATAIAEPVLMDLAMHAQFLKYIPFSDRNAMKKRIVDQLRSMEIASNAIENVCQIWNEMAENKLYNKLYYSIENKCKDLPCEDNLKKLVGEYSQYGKSIPVDDLERFLTDNNLKRSDFVDEITEYRYFLKNHDIRSPDRISQ